MSPSRGLFPALLTILLAGARAAGAAPVQVIASDERGVTLRVSLPEPSAREIAPDGRVRITVPGFDLTTATGRARVPYATALVALPPGARPSARVIEAGAEIAEDVDLELGPQPLFHPDSRTGQLLPDWAPAAPEGPAVWPPSPVELGESFELRRQRLVKVTLYPWRYDARARRLHRRSQLTVRVDFGARSSSTTLALPVPPDPAADALFRDAVVNAEAARAWRRAPRALDARPPVDRLFAGGARTLGAFEEDEPEVRVLCDSTGVYGLDFDELGAAGYPAGVPVSQVSVHRHEYIEDAATPYVTIELPSEVEDANGNGTFDPGDHVIVYVQSWAERSGASVPQRAWGWGEVVYVTRLAGGGLRPATRSGWRGATGLTPPTSFPHLERYERDVDYFNVGSVFSDTTNDPYHWTIQSAYYFPDESVVFDVNHLDNTVPAQVTISWQGRSPDPHVNWAQIRNGNSQLTTVVDSAVWGGRTRLTRSAAVPGTALTEGRTNRWRLWGKTNPFAPPHPTDNSRSQAGLNWFEITYGRLFRPILGVLPCNSGTLAGEYELLARGFTDPARLRVYDVTDPAQPVKLTGFQVAPAGGAYDVRLQDSTGATRREYVIFDQVRTPGPGRITPVTRRALHGNAAGDYLVIVPEAFLAAVDPLVQLRQSQGYSVVVAPLEAVNDEFNGGRRSSHAIKRFIRYGYQRWNTQQVLLVGDGSEDPRKIDPNSGTDWVPVHRIFAPVLVNTPTTGTFYEAGPSDPWYGFCLDCPEPQLQPRIPEVFVGRLPVNSLAQAQAVIAKLTAYEQPQADEAWRRRMTLVSDDAYSGESFFAGGSGSSNYCYRSYEEVFREINESVRSLVLNDAALGLSEPEVFNLRYFLPFQSGDTIGVNCVQPVPPARDTCRCRRSDFQTRARATVTPELMTRLNAGRLWFNYQGHANERVMSHEDFYVNQPTRDDKDLLVNDGRPFLYTGFSCHPNAFAHFQELGARWGTPAFGEDLVTLPNRGAIASWGSFSYELLPLVASRHLNVHFARALFGAMTVDQWAEPFANPRSGAVLGEVIATTLLNNYREQPGSMESQVGITYTLLGDPGTRISMGPPQAQVTANTQPVTSGVPVRLRIGRDSIHVDARIASNVRLDSLAVFITSPAGVTTRLDSAQVAVTPAFPDTAVETSGRGRRYRVQFRDSLIADTYRYTIRTVDANRRANPFEVRLAFETVLLADGAPVNDLDVISPNAALTLRVLSPKGLDPATDLTLRVGGVVQPFTFTADNGDTSGREWTLAWTHGPYPFGDTSVELRTMDGAMRIHRFRVNILGSELRIQNPLAFPNPFEDDLGTHFSFMVESASATDVRIRVYTVSGRLIYERRELGLSPGYHQFAWDGRDAEGDKLANGLYVYKITARNDSRTATVEGRLVKLRKPRRVEEEAPVAP